MPIPVTGEHAIANRRLLRDDVFDRLLEAITTGTLEPGERLRDEELATWLGVSRTPIREAITRLVDMGLVEMEPNRYTKVSEIDPARFLDAQLVASSLYRIAVRLAMPKLSDLQIADVDDLLVRSQKTVADGGGLDALLDFWSVIMVFVNNSENLALQRILDDLFPDLRRISIPTWSHVAPENLSGFFSDFRTLVLKRDGEAAGRLLEESSLRFGQQMAKAAQVMWPGAEEPSTSSQK